MVLPSLNFVKVLTFSADLISYIQIASQIQRGIKECIL